MANKSSDDVRQIMLETARVQAATLNAGIVFWSSWVDKASKLSQTINNALADMAQPDGNTDAVIGKVTDASREYLRELRDLPNQAVARFNEEVGRDSGKKGTKQSRSARAKD